MAHFKKENHYLSNVPDANLLKVNDVLKPEEESIKKISVVLGPRSVMCHASHQCEYFTVIGWIL